jgi:hypothetical protein
MEATSLIVQDSATGLDALAGIDAVTSGNSWLVTLNHGVGGDWLSTPTSVVVAMFDRAIAKGAWIGTYQDVAAYWKASAVMDTTRAVPDATGWRLSWQLPWKRSPRTIVLRVRFDSTVFGKDFAVAQGGHGVYPESDGSFRIDFLKGALRVERSLSSSAQRSSAIRPFALSRRGAQIELRSPPLGTALYSLTDFDGRSVARGHIATRGGLTTISCGNPQALVVTLRSERGTLLASGMIPPALTGR